MLLAIDIGNSAAKFGGFGDHGLERTARLDHARGEEPDDLRDALRALGFRPDEAIVSSVVPHAVRRYVEAIRSEFGIAAVVPDHSFDFGLSVNYRPAEDCGLDRLLAASAASEIAGVPCIVCDFGTATTVDAVSADRAFLGGTISPGIGTFAASLHKKTAKLPLVELEVPDRAIGRSTVESITSGIYFGYAGLVDGLIRRIAEELGGMAQIVATGGYAELIAGSSGSISKVEPHLVLEGLRLVHERNVSKRQVS